MGLPSCLKESVPFVAMVLLECGNVGMTTISKAAMNHGMSSFVFIVYYNILGIIIFLPYYIFHIYRNKPPPLTSALVFRFFILGLLGKGSLLFGYAGIKYSSPTLFAALGNLIPVFTFLLAIVFRLENIDIKRLSTRAKSLGTIVAVSGAFIVTFYKGPRIFSGTSQSSLPHQFLLSQHSYWLFGGLLIGIAQLFGTIWSIFQVVTVKEYPSQETVIFFYVLFGTMQSAVVTFFIEKSTSAWKLHTRMEMTAIVYSAFYSTVIYNIVVTWCLNKKGPLYVSMFRPLGMIVAMMGGIVFLGDILHLGSVIGAIIIAIGFYTVLWGQAREKEMVAVDICIFGSATQNSGTTHLLPNSEEQEP